MSREEVILPAGLSERLLDYELKYLLGDGASGHVYLAGTIIDDEYHFVAIKVIRRRTPGDESKFLLCNTEKDFMEFVNKLENFGMFTKVIETFSDAFNYYYVMVSLVPMTLSGHLLIHSKEYIPGGTLRDEMNGSRYLEEDRAAMITAQLVSIFRLVFAVLRIDDMRF